MLTARRLPSFHKLGAEIATRADTEGWPAARFLAVLAQYALAGRNMRRIRRHLNEAQLPAGKALATFDFKALPTLPRARVEALAAGDWLDGGGTLIAIHCPLPRHFQCPARQWDSACLHARVGEIPAQIRLMARRTSCAPSIAWQLAVR